MRLWVSLKSSPHRFRLERPESGTLLGYESSLHSWLLLNKLPLHNKLPLNYRIKSVSFPCQRTRITQEWGLEKTTGEESGLRQNFLDFNCIYNFFPHRHPPLPWTLISPPTPHLAWLPLSSSFPAAPSEQEADSISGHLALLMMDRKWQEGTA